MSYNKEELILAHETVKSAGSQRKAAKRLGMSRRSLQRRLSAYEATFLEKKANQLSFDKDKVSGYWIKDKEGSFYVRNDIPINYNELRENYLEEAQLYAPVYVKNPIKVEQKSLPQHLLVIDIADAHFNKLALAEETGQEYNLEIAENRMREGVKHLVRKAEVHGIDRILFVLGNDQVHTDTTTNTTTAGTPQDTVSLWWKGFQVAKKCYISCIEELANIAPVHLIFNPSNHDYMSGFMLADTISSWFSNHPNVVTKDGSLSISHRKYIQYGQNLIGFTHGDTAKETDLPNLMQFEARRIWGNTKYAYWYTHHYHVKDRKAIGKNKFQIEKDKVGLTIINTGQDIAPTDNVFVEVVRSPSGADSWHYRNGHLGNVSVECFLHHIDNGQVARFTHYF